MLLNLINQGGGAYNVSPPESYTQSSVALSPFAAMTTQKRSLLDTLADYAGRLEGAVTSVKGGVTALRTPGGVAQPQTPFGNLNFGNNSIFKNPLVIAGIAVAAVYMLRK